MSPSRVRLAAGAIGVTATLAASLGVAWFLLGGSASQSAGELLYREGRLASGDLVQATVMGDVPVTGTQVLCTNCHGRSGMGTEETGTRTPPIAGPFLFDKSIRTNSLVYNEQTLARALRDGVDPTGRPLDPLMPRYPLADEDMAALTAYLRTLGEEPPVGADSEHLRLATVIADDVPEATRKAVIDVLNAFVQDKNAEGRNDGARSKARTKEGRIVAPYRVWSLDVWEVTGPPNGWRAQLDARYRAEPVFALVSGVAAGSWAPMHGFCEDNAIPCLLPNTDRPPSVEGDFYSLYYSEGLTLEAEIIAESLQAAATLADVLQVVQDDDEAAADAADALAERVREAGGGARTQVVPAGPVGHAAVAEALAAPASAVVLWTRGPPPAVESSEAPTGSEAPPVYLSATFVGRDLDVVPESLRPRTRVVSRFTSEGGRDSGLRRFRLWAKLRGVEVTDERVQAQTWFACLALIHGVDHTEKYLQRDYVIDSLDHASGLTAFMPIYPRGTLGPGQRYVSKGAMVVDLSGGSEPRWVVP